MIYYNSTEGWDPAVLCYLYKRELLKGEKWQCQWEGDVLFALKVKSFGNLSPKKNMKTVSQSTPWILSQPPTSQNPPKPEIVSAIMRIFHGFGDSQQGP